MQNRHSRDTVVRVKNYNPDMIDNGFYSKGFYDAFYSGVFDPACNWIKEHKAMYKTGFDDARKGLGNV